MKLSKKLYETIENLSNEGNDYLDCGMYEKAIDKFNTAFSKLPNPKTNWEAGTWLQVALGDCYYFMNDFKESLHYFTESLKFPNSIGNAYINLRIGQCYFELGNYKKAKDFLTMAYAIEGDEVFIDEDLKYKNLIYL